MNPIIKALAHYWLYAKDLKAAPAPEIETKLYYQQDIGAAIMMGTLIHGPGATDLINGVYGNNANSAVFACLDTICTSFPEAPAKVWRVQANEREWIMDHSMQPILDRPNPHMDAEVFWYWVQWAKHCAGNAYVEKIRSGNEDTGNVVELWPISPRLIEPVTEKGSGDFITFYKHNYAPGYWRPIYPHNMIHFRFGLNDADMRVGMSPLQRLVREVATDDEATRFSDALLHNYGVPGLVVTTPPGSEQMTEDDARKLKERVSLAFGNDGRGNVGVLSNGATMAPFGFDPQQLDLKGLHRIPEERISAVLNVPAILAGLGAGLDRATYSNVQEAGQIFTERKLIPMWRADAGVLNRQLIRDFTLDRRVMVAFDISDVRALQEDENAKYTRLDIGVAGGWIDPDEARADVGLPPRGAANTPPQLRAVAGRSGFQLKAGDFARYPELFEAMVALAQPGLEAELEDFFDGQRRRIKRRVLEA